MTALAADRNTPMRDGEVVSTKVAAGAKIYAGAMVAVSATGFATPGAVSTTIKYWGRAEEMVDNTGGADGDVSVEVRRGQAFKWQNEGTDPLTQADVGNDCYIFDDQSVAKTSGTSTRSIAGKVIAVDSDGVWVQ